MQPSFSPTCSSLRFGEFLPRVFKLDGLQTGAPISPKRICRIVAKIGKAAGVVVNKADDKYASAHDLRRAFGTRWAKRVMPAVLKRLMRHASIDTTMSYYVALDSADVADELWAKFGPTCNNPYNKRCGKALGAETATVETPTEAVEAKEVI